MSTIRLYRAMHRSAKSFDRESWRRPLLLQHPCLQQYTVTASQGVQGSDTLGAAAFFLQPQSQSSSSSSSSVPASPTHTQDLLRHHFRAAVLKKGDLVKSLNHGFQVLRALSSSSGPSIVPVVTPSSSSSVGGSSVLRAPQPISLMKGAQTSTLGRMHQDSGVDMMKPKTPPPMTNQNFSKSVHTSSSSSSSKDSKYQQAVFQSSIYAQHYLGKVLSLGSDLQLIDASRMKHQQVAWTTATRANLSHAQQFELESLVRTLGTSVESKNLTEVLAFQSRIASLDRALLVPLLSNNMILDAWIEYLASQHSYSAMVALLKLRLASGVSTSEFGMSRQSQCRILLACAIEGDVAASMMVLRETSWAALATAPAQVAEPDYLTPSVFKGLPSSSRQLPSWIPNFYSHESAETSTFAMMPSMKASVQAEIEPDTALAQSGAGFGLDAQSVTIPIATSSSQQPQHQVPIVHVPARLPVNSHKIRQVSPLAAASLSTLLTTSKSAARVNSHATMSTRARVAPVQVPTEISSTPPPTPPTPLPIIDLHHELQLDSDLMELAILASIRHDSRATEMTHHQHYRTTSSMSSDHNLSLEEHAAVALGLMHRDQYEHRNYSSSDDQTTRRSRRYKRVAEIPEDEVQPDGVEDEIFEEDDDSSSSSSAFAPQQPSLFKLMNNSASTPFSFSLYSIMLKQQIPLQHSHTYTSLIQHLDNNFTHQTIKSRLTNSLLQTLSTEFTHARSASANAPLANKVLRGDLTTFLTTEFNLTKKLAQATSEHNDSLFQLLALLKQMQKERINVDQEELADVYRMLLSSDSSVGRTQLLQDFLVVTDELPSKDGSARIDAATSSKTSPASKSQNII